MDAITKFKKSLNKRIQSLEVRKDTVKNVVTGNIYRAMEEEGKSKSDLAEMLGVSRAAVTSFLSGDRNFTIDKITEICHHLGRFPEIRFRDHAECIRPMIRTTTKYTWERCAEFTSVHNFETKTNEIKFSFSEKRGITETHEKKG